jgi:hypothetical protein
MVITESGSKIFLEYRARIQIQIFYEKKFTSFKVEKKINFYGVQQSTRVQRSSDGSALACCKADQSSNLGSVPPTEP